MIWSKESKDLKGRFIYILEEEKKYKEIKQERNRTTLIITE